MHHHAANKIRQLFAKKQGDAEEGRDSADDVAANSSGQSPPPPQQRPIDGHHSGEGGDYGNGDQGHSRPFPYEESQLRLTRWLVVATAVIAVATVIYMAFSGLQLREIRSSGEDTRNLAQSAGRSANAATDQVNAMRGQLDTMNQQTNTMREQTNTMNKSLDLTNRAVTSGEIQAKTSQVSARAAQESAQVARRAFDIGERPYLAVKHITLNDFVAEKRPYVVILFENAGKTPALNVITKGYSDFNIAPEWQKVEYRKLPKLSRQFVQSGGIYELKFFISDVDEAIPEFVLNAIKSQQIWIVIYGVSEYTDGVGKGHVMRFCAFYDIKASEFKNCSEHNDST